MQPNWGDAAPRMVLRSSRAISASMPVEADSTRPPSESSSLATTVTMYIPSPEISYSPDPPPALGAALVQPPLIDLGDPAEAGAPAFAPQPIGRSPAARGSQAPPTEPARASLPPPPPATVRPPRPCSAQAAYRPRIPGHDGRRYGEEHQRSPAFVDATNADEEKEEDRRTGRSRTDQTVHRDRNRHNGNNNNYNDDNYYNDNNNWTGQAARRHGCHRGP